MEQKDNKQEKTPTEEPKKKEIVVVAAKKKQRFTVKVDLLIPATLTYQLEAEDMEEALKKTEASRSGGTLQLHHGQRKIKLTAKVYRQGTSNLLKTKAYK